MEKWMLIVDFILITGISFLGLIIVFLIKSRKQFFQRILIAFFVNAIFFLLYYYSYLHKLHILGAIAVLFGNGVGFLLGPLLYFQLKSLIYSKAKYIKSLYLQLIPFLLCWLCISVPLSVCMITGDFSGYGKLYFSVEPYINIIENLFFLTYIFLSFKLWIKIRALSEENYSSVKMNNLSWYRHLLTGFVIIVVLDTLCTVYELFFPMIPWNIGTLVAFSFVLMYLYLGYKGMFQSQILLPDFLLQEKIASSIANQDKSQQAKGQLEYYTQEEIEELKIRLYDLLKTQKLYLNDTLSLTELSEEMKISNKKLSELLNRHVNTSFYNLINEYRVNEVIERMKIEDSEKYTLLGIAYESGFQSKASFNRIFKQKTGVSPSKFKRELKLEHESVV
jgi:AraC-like DNA-binding protein